ncbi:hypothetical protein A0H81_06553 [Grifola frondosa]|uniref:Uncharacterized protein n=1 Tax=Grifola frondosa TaxID=5627 RepID=A0A1C7LJZ7_GRIFR|nr:hypothetical protein A0H81_15000 [Grifola frondosa]OBZ73927.1 hypothetical protein A0H81_06553 [Grifola frondosa]
MAGLKDKVSITEITNRIEDTLMGLYQARGYQEKDLDIALLYDLFFDIATLLALFPRYACRPSRRSNSI